MKTQQELNTMFKQYMPVAERAAKSFYSICGSNEYDFDDIYQDAMESLWVLLHRDNLHEMRKI